MATIPFQIEVVLAAQGFVIARRLAPQLFELTGASRLKGCPIAPMELPRAKAADGAARDDLFAFRLKARADGARFKPGDVVELSDWRERA